MRLVHTAVFKNDIKIQNINKAEPESEMPFPGCSCFSYEIFTLVGTRAKYKCLITDYLNRQTLITSAQAHSIFSIQNN